MHFHQLPLAITVNFFSKQLLYLSPTSPDYEKKHVWIVELKMKLLSLKYLLRREFLANLKILHSSFTIMAGWKRKTKPSLLSFFHTSCWKMKKDMDLKKHLFAYFS